MSPIKAVTCLSPSIFIITSLRGKEGRLAVGNRFPHKLPHNKLEWEIALSFLVITSLATTIPVSPFSYLPWLDATVPLQQIGDLKLKIKTLFVGLVQSTFNGWPLKIIVPFPAVHVNIVSPISTFVPIMSVSRSSDDHAKWRSRLQRGSKIES